MTVLYALLLLIIAFFLYVWYISKGKTTPIAGNKSIATIEKFTIGGIEQYATVRGVDKSNPVLLYLHGGPGFPEVALAKPYSAFLEEHFVVVHWEQRGAGKTFALNGAKGLSVEQLIEDTAALSKLFSTKFDQKKVYLLGHSWGTFLGVLTVQKYPELFHAYLGIGQVCNQYKAEEVSLRWIKERNNKIDIRLPSKNAPIAVWESYMNKQRAYVIKYGGSIHKEKNVLKQLFELVFATEYTFSEKIKFFKGALASFRALWLEVIGRDLTQTVQKLDVPVYLFQGAYDYQTATSVAKVFFDQLEAPRKKFFLFEHSAHSPHFEEVEKFNQIVRDEVIISD